MVEKHPQIDCVMKYHFLCHTKGFGISFLSGLILEESDFTHNFLDLLRIALMPTNIQGSCIGCRKMVSPCLWLCPHVEHNYIWRWGRWEGKTYYVDEAILNLLLSHPGSFFPGHSRNSFCLAQLLSSVNIFSFCCLCPPTKLIYSG